MTGRPCWINAALLMVTVPAAAQSQMRGMAGMEGTAGAKPAPALHADPIPDATPASAAQDRTMASGDAESPLADPPSPPKVAQLARAPGIDMTGTALPVADAPPPAAPTDHYADRSYAPAANADARALMMHQQGGQSFDQVMFNLAEFQVHDGHEGYRWDGEAWFGGDITRVTIKSEGEGTLHKGVDSAELQLLYSRAVGPYFNLQGGVRHDVAPTPTRTYLTVGVEGLAPYMFQTEARAFVATTGQVLGRLEGWYDQRLTQRLVLQPRVELNFAAQNDRRVGMGSGLVDAELGLRLRYEIAREFAPYVGVSSEAETGRTAAYSRAAGKNATTTSFVAGARFWF